MNNASPKLHIEENIPLAPFTTFGIGGPARYFARASNEEQICEGLRFAVRCACPLFILGGGSNLFVSDAGFQGLVLKIELKGIDGLSGGNDGIVSAAGGEEWDAFVRQGIEHSLAGIECLSGIPGTVGATPVQNVGAYGQESGEVIRAVHVLDRESLAPKDFSNAQCGFGYRTSIFNSAAQDRYVIMRVDFSLRPGGAPRIEYQDLMKHFARHAGPPSLREVREAVLEIRRSKGMTLDPHDADSRSAGSFFRNPVVTPMRADALEQKVRECGILAASEHMPRFKTPSGEEKLPAAWLIERAGFARGFSIGRAGISTKHSLALVNRGGACAQDILDLMRRIQDQVHTLFELELQPEPIFVGFNCE